MDFRVSRRFIFYINESVAKFIDGLESSSFTVRFIDVFNSFRDICDKISYSRKLSTAVYHRSTHTNHHYLQLR